MLPAPRRTPAAGGSDKNEESAPRAVGGAIERAIQRGIGKAEGLEMANAVESGGAI